MLKKGDIILVAIILVAVLLGTAGFNFLKKSDAGNKNIAVIRKDNRIIRKIDLDKVKESERITVGGSYRDTILVEKGRIRFEEADCPDQVCVKTGWLSKKGDMAVCLPNRTIIKIEGETDEVDGTTY